MRISSFVSLAVCLFASLTVSYGQERKAPAAYNSSKYRIAYHSPERTYINAAAADGSEVIYKGPGVRVRFSVIADPEVTGPALKSARSFTDLVNLIIDGREEEVSKGSGGDLIFGNPEIKEVQIAGISSARFNVVVGSESEAEERERYTGFVIPVREHNRIYVFIMDSPSAYYDGWLPLVERSVTSFAVMKAADKTEAALGGLTADKFLSDGAEWNRAKGYELALDGFTNALKLNPSFVEAFHSRGHTYVRMGKHDQAMTDFTAAIKLAPTNADLMAELLIDRALINVEQKKEYALALVDANKAIELKPKLAKPYLMRAYVHCAMGKKTNAAEDETSAIALGAKITERCQ